MLIQNYINIHQPTSAGFATLYRQVLRCIHTNATSVSVKSRSTRKHPSLSYLSVSNFTGGFFDLFASSGAANPSIKRNHHRARRHPAESSTLPKYPRAGEIKTMTRKLPLSVRERTLESGLRCCRGQRGGQRGQKMPGKKQWVAPRQWWWLGSVTGWRLERHRTDRGATGRGRGRGWRRGWRRGRGRGRRRDRDAARHCRHVMLQHRVTTTCAQHTPLRSPSKLSEQSGGTRCMSGRSSALVSIGLWFGAQESGGRNDEGFCCRAGGDRAGQESGGGNLSSAREHLHTHRATRKNLQTVKR